MLQFSPIIYPEWGELISDLSVEEQAAIFNAILKYPNVEFVGFKQWKDIKVLVGQARFCVIPSECYENNPFSVIEAQCLGTPVVGARIGGIPDLIKDEQDGLLFESKNPDDLKNKIEEMFNRSFNYKILAEKSQVKYSSEQYYSKLMDLYTKVLR